MYKVKIDPEIFEQFPQFNALVVYADGLENKASDEYSNEKLLSVEKKQVDSINKEYPKLSEHPHIAAWRKAYSQFGAKPKKYHCSAEALLKRPLKGESVPRINYLVDIYNALSMEYVIPFGGEDRDSLTSDLHLKLAKGDEEFTVQSSGGEVNDSPSQGEVVYCDSKGVTCRRWNWRQSARTALTEKTKNAYFIIEILPPYDMGILKSAAKHLVDEIKKLSPNAKISIDHLGSHEELDMDLVAANK